MSQRGRVFNPEFRIEVARRIVAGESVSQLHHELSIKRSVLYRWRDAYRKEGEAGLARPAGRPPGTPNRVKPSSSEAERLRQQLAQLERKVGQQTVLLDFFKGAFKRVKESGQPNGGAGGTASTKRQEP
jgi:transposase-like protein